MTIADETPRAVVSAIAEAQRIMTAVQRETWPSSREAMAAIGRARDYALGEIGVYGRLARGDMDWTGFDADLMFFGGDPQEEAVVIAEKRAYDAAIAVMRCLRQYQRREAVLAGTGAAR